MMCLEIAVEKAILDSNRIKIKEDKITSEKEIFSHIQKGDKEAYQIIVEHYMKRAYYIALGFVHNQQDALDVSQEAFIKAFHHIKRFHLDKPFFPWFYQLIKNICLDHLKKRKNLHELPLDDVQILDEEKEDREMKELLWKGIKELPWKQREVVLLRYFQNLSYKEIAELTCKPVGTVMSSLYYAKIKLKELVGNYLNYDTNGAK